MSVPYSWVKKLEILLDSKELIPDFGRMPSFPFDEYINSLSKSLSISNLYIKLKESSWRNFEDLGTGFGQNYDSLSINVLPFYEDVHWIMSSESVKTLMHILLTENKQEDLLVVDSTLRRGFYHYLCLEAIQALNSIKPFENISFEMNTPSSLPNEGAICLDFEINIDGNTIFGRLVIPKRIPEELKSLFASHPIPLEKNELIQTTELDLRLEAASTTLNKSDLEKVKVGDFITLDRCFFNPITHKGSFNLSLANHPLFHAQYKEGNLKILDFSFQQEENYKMEETNENAFPEEQKGTVGELVSSEEIPLVLTVEMARIKMSLENLLKLKPGSLIELSLKPQDSVDITVNNARIAKAEIVQLGEVLGLKILQIG